MPDTERKPIYQHDCQNCEFLGHWFGYDVWICYSQGDPFPTGSIIARFGNDGPDYDSGPVEVVFRQSQMQDGKIGLVDGKIIPYAEWLFSNERSSTQAMALGILCHYTKIAKGYQHLQRKVSHGCTDMTCGECDHAKST